MEGCWRRTWGAVLGNGRACQAWGCRLCRQHDAGQDTCPAPFHWPSCSCVLETPGLPGGVHKCLVEDREGAGVPRERAETGRGNAREG